MLGEVVNWATEFSFVSLLATWGSMRLELFVAAAMLASGRWRFAAAEVPVVFHMLIGFIVGIWISALAMIPLVILIAVDALIGSRRIVART